MKSGVRQVVLNRVNGLVVPANTVLEKGMEVLRIPCIKRHTYAFGGPSEDSGIILDMGVVEIAGHKEVMAAVQWASGLQTDEILDKLLAVVDLNNYLETSGKDFSLKPLYHIDQVLFVLPDARMRNSPMYPAVGSSYETDVKVIDIITSRFGNHVLYNTYIPNAGYVTFKQENLITAKEKDRLKHEDFKEYFFGIDSPPFLKKGEKVKAYDGYIYNFDESVVLKITEDLRKYLTWSIKQAAPQDIHKPIEQDEQNPQ